MEANGRTRNGASALKMALACLGTVTIYDKWEWGMQYRGIRYDVKMALGRDEWVWTVYTVQPKQGKVSGGRWVAVERVERVIDTWCREHPADCAAAA
jgi:hypothetical protein